MPVVDTRIPMANRNIRTQGKFIFAISNRNNLQLNIWKHLIDRSISNICFFQSIIYRKLVHLTWLKIILCIVKVSQCLTARVINWQIISLQHQSDIFNSILSLTDFIGIILANLIPNLGCTGRDLTTVGCTLAPNDITSQYNIHDVR